MCVRERKSAGAHKLLIRFLLCTPVAAATASVGGVGGDGAAVAVG